MKKQLLVLLLCLLGITFNVKAQSFYEDVVHLKNGSIIRGIIIEQVPNETIKIETRDGNIFVYKMDEIQKLTKEQPTGNYRNQKAYGGRAYTQNNYAQSGYFGMVEAGWGLGVGNWSANRFNFNFVNGYKIVPQFSIGFGVGFRYYSYYVYDSYSDYKSNDFTLPIFVHLRTDILDSKVTPFVAFNIGYNLSLSGGFFGGLLMEPTIGVGFKLARKSQLNIGIGYAIDRVQYYYDGYYGKAMGGAINFKVGFMF